MNKFTKFFVTAVSVILAFSVVFIFLVFIDDGIIDLNPIEGKRYGDFDRITVSSIVEEVEQEQVAGIQNSTIGNNTPPPSAVIPGQAPPVTMTGSDILISADAARVEQVLASSSFSAKAKDLAAAYQVCKDVGLPDNAAIGLMANVWHEGRMTVVEYAFSSSHFFGFSLPTGGTTAKTTADIVYLRTWPTVTTQRYYDANSDLTYQNASCGFGSVQWSFGRRVQVCDLYMSFMQQANTDAITPEIAFDAEMNMYKHELRSGGTYVAAVQNGVSQIGDTCENWAEAFCDIYVKPSGWCGSKSLLTATGSGCQARRATATELARVLRGI